MLALFGCAVPDCVTAIVSDAPAEVDTRETVRANSRAQLSDLFEDEAPPRLQRKRKPPRRNPPRRRRRTRADRKAVPTTIWASDSLIEEWKFLCGIFFWFSPYFSI